MARRRRDRRVPPRGTSRSSSSSSAKPQLFRRPSRPPTLRFRICPRRPTGDPAIHFSDSLPLRSTQTPRLAGAFACWGAASAGGPRGGPILAAISGGGAAPSAHVAKASVRVGSSVTALGLAHPILSVIEDVLAVINGVVARLLPWLVV